MMVNRLFYILYILEIYVFFKKFDYNIKNSAIYITEVKYEQKLSILNT